MKRRFAFMANSPNPTGSEWPFHDAGILETIIDCGPSVPYIVNMQTGNQAHPERGTKMITIHITNEDETGQIVTTKLPEEYKTRAKAMAAAKKAAGRGAFFFERGVDFGYRGPNGTAWVCE